MAGITQETAGSFTLSELEIAQVFEQGTLYPVRTSDRVHHQAVYEKITDFLGVIDVNCAFLSPCEMKVGRALILLADRKKVRPERRKTGLVSEHCHDFLTRITHQIKNEVQNELNICQLRKAITEKDELMATTGHILVAPLSKAHGKVQGLRELISEHSVEAIAEESDIINFLCNSLCEDIVRCSGLSRSFRFLTTLGKQSEFYRFDKDVSLLELVNKCVEDFRYLAADRSIRFDVATSGFVSKVRLDGDKLEIALGNLLDNAIKYSDVGRTVIIRISQDRSDVLLTISNFGVGIPQEEWELVFERYYRSKIHDPNRFIPGTGIGLTVVKEIITKQGGLIDVTSKQGPSSIGGSSSVKGFNTTFHIRLPRKGRRT